MPTILGANTLSGYDVDNSLRFNDGDTPNLVRTISSGADVTKFTFYTSAMSISAHIIRWGKEKNPIFYVVIAA